MEVGFIGLGHMGLGMARRLLQAGHALTVYNRTRERAEPLGAEGARVADRPADASRGEAVVTMVSDDHALEAVVFGPDGVLEALPAGALHVSMSTVSPALVERLARAHAERGQRFVSAPVFGRPEAAAAGQLAVVAAGPEADVARAQPFFEAFGPKLFRFGDTPSRANVIKLSGNFLLAAAIESMAEAFAFVRKSGVPAEDYFDFLQNSVFASAITTNYGGMIAAERYRQEAGFKLPLALKDVRLALGAADAAGVPMPVASVLHDLMLATVSQGHTDLDWAGLGWVAARNAGLAPDAEAGKD